VALTEQAVRFVASESDTPVPGSTIWVISKNVRDGSPIERTVHVSHVGCQAMNRYIVHAEFIPAGAGGAVLKVPIGKPIRSPAQLYVTHIGVRKRR
jgi:hypothetical protein